MRTIGFRSNVLFIVAAAFGLLAVARSAVVRRRSPAHAEETRIGDVHGPVEAFFPRLAARVHDRAAGRRLGCVHDHGHDPGRARRGRRASARSGRCIARRSSSPARELLRLATLAMLGIVVVKLANTPDAVGLVERRQGAGSPLGVTGIMASSAATLYTRRSRAASRRGACTTGRQRPRRRGRTCSTRAGPRARPAEPTCPS